MHAILKPFPDSKDKVSDEGAAKKNKWKYSKSSQLRSQGQSKRPVVVLWKPSRWRASTASIGGVKVRQRCTFCFIVPTSEARAFERAWSSYIFRCFQGLSTIKWKIKQTSPVTRCSPPSPMSRTRSGTRGARATRSLYSETQRRRLHTVRSMLQDNNSPYLSCLPASINIPSSTIEQRSSHISRNRPKMRPLKDR